MKIAILALVLSVTNASTGASADACTPSRNKCDFYPACLEREVQCGDGGYALGYGHRYCGLFQQAKPEFSAAGSAWLESTTLCLQAELLKIVETADKGGLACGKVKKLAFERFARRLSYKLRDVYACTPTNECSHPKCYVESGVCELPVGDMGRIVGVIGWKQLVSDILALKQSAAVASRCLLKLAQSVQLNANEARLT